jgi:hypothetical protein
MAMTAIAAAMAAGCAAVVMSAMPGFAAQTPQEHQQATTTEVQAAPGMDAKCQAMMAEKEEMMADMKAADQRLDALVVTMNAASGMDQPAATAAVVSEMVTQRKTMRGGMMKMQEDMMGHMMEHMQARPGAMTMCPMMKMRH